MADNLIVKPATPLMQQYLQLKARHPNDFLFFRLGDFFELFGEDAKRAAPILEVALTHRQQEPMCGVPAHSVDSYIAKLLRAGHRVALAEQLEEPSGGKSIVRRDVVRVITPGTLQEDTLLAAKKSNYLMALCSDGQRVGLAAVDCSTGEFATTELTGTLASSIVSDELARLSPSEVVLPAGTDALWRQRLQAAGYALAELPVNDFSGPFSEERLKKTFSVGSLRGFGLEAKPQALAACGAVLRYIENTQCGRAVTIRPPQTYSLDDTLQLDAATLDHLDLMPDSKAIHSRPTLLGVLDQTLTPMGGRLLRRWLVSPLKKVAAIENRQNRVAFFLDQRQTRLDARRLLAGWPDFERILSRVAAGSASPRDLAHLSSGLCRLPALVSLLSPQTGTTLFTPIEPDEPLSDLLAQAIVEAPPPSAKEGGVIRDGFNAELDEVRGWIKEGKSRLLELEQKERERTGIASLKVGFNNIFGYFLEVTKTHLAKVPPEYTRKQTTANGERYITPELKEFENRVLGAQERAFRLEGALLQSIRETILAHADLLRRNAEAIAQLDIAQGLAEVADRRGYRRPKVDDSTTFSIQEGRHPVLEEVLPSGTLIANDLLLDGRQRQVMVLTGPNMSGKSTYLRQNALIAILAQMGSYVPAAEAHIGVLDSLYTRIGASDRLLEGESTFMVEMVETARILNHATERSLVILDEVGRGTSTYDGMAIAAACLEFLHQTGAKVLFATHYLELTDMANRFPGIINAHVTAQESGEDVVFLHKVKEGPADRAYGIHVARLAGIPKTVLLRAATLLEELQHTSTLPKPVATYNQPSLFDSPNDTLLQEFRRALEGIDVNSLTPLQALVLLQEWQTKLHHMKEGHE